MPPQAKPAPSSPPKLHGRRKRQPSNPKDMNKRPKPNDLDPSNGEHARPSKSTTVRKKSTTAGKKVQKKCYVPYHRSNSISVSARDALQAHSWSSNITSHTLPFFRPDNFRLGPSPPAPYHKQNHYYPILRYFTCQWTPSNTCILFGISDYGYARSRYHMIQSISPHVDALNKAYNCKRGKGNPKNETDENIKKGA